MKKVLMWLFLSIGIVLGAGWIGCIMFIIWDDIHKVLYWQIFITCTLLLTFWFMVATAIDE